MNTVSVWCHYLWGQGGSWELIGILGVSSGSVEQVKEWVSKQYDHLQSCLGQLRSSYNLPYMFDTAWNAWRNWWWTRNRSNASLSAEMWRHGLWTLPKTTNCSLGAVMTGLPVMVGGDDNVYAKFMHILANVHFIYTVMVLLLSILTIKGSKENLHVLYQDIALQTAIFLKIEFHLHLKVHLQMFKF